MFYPRSSLILNVFTIMFDRVHMQSQSFQMIFQSLMTSYQSVILFFSAQVTGFFDFVTYFVPNAGCDTTHSQDYLFLSRSFDYIFSLISVTICSLIFFIFFLFKKLRFRQLNEKNLFRSNLIEKSV